MVAALVAGVRHTDGVVVAGAGHVVRVDVDVLRGAGGGGYDQSNVVRSSV